jgi:predicted N-acetyltransferase YhbS
MKAPAPLTSDHDVSNFDCGNEVMNTWLRERALRNQDEGATRTFVVCNDDGRMLGYYALAVGSCERGDAHASVSRGMPDPVLMMILARLAVDRSVQGSGLGRQLIADAVMRTVKVAEQAGVRGLMVSAIDKAATAYYERLGFVRAKRSDDVLMLRLKVAQDVLGRAR